MRIFPAFMTIPLSLGLLLMMLQGHVQAGSRSQQDHQAPPSATTVKETKSGPKVDRSLVIRTISAHREDFKRRGFDAVATPLKMGERLPDNVESEQLPDTVKQALPRYEGYAWRRIGNDIVLIGIASNTFYDIFPNILDDDHTS
ncbi:Nickel/cobalt transporter regulator [Kushneria avicenniae]|uniref:Nickel/cobalt transporter regulator n=1 Tax=Kushneria avicenniae TaxID=402385 RepID=A0A1I1GL25_9GAMM|nr:RcnB family protein [Kushneria avicenniae]SFC12181.1 Nickel/cobalt transporter regulator [Kushneria avicenniae]